MVCYVWYAMYLKPVLQGDRKALVSADRRELQACVLLEVIDKILPLPPIEFVSAAGRPVNICRIKPEFDKCKDAPQCRVVVFEGGNAGSDHGAVYEKRHQSVSGSLTIQVPQPGYKGKGAGEKWVFSLYQRFLFYFGKHVFDREFCPACRADPVEI